MSNYRMISLLDFKFACKQWLKTRELGYAHPRRMRRLSRDRSLFFAMRVKCDELIRQKGINAYLNK